MKLSAAGLILSSLLLAAPTLAAESTPATSAKEQRYKLHAYLIDGASTQARQPDLVLWADGSFSVGRARGSWREAERGVVLQGGYTEWGVGELSADRQSLVFRFERGGMAIEMKMARIPDAPALLADVSQKP